MVLRPLQKILTTPLDKTLSHPFFLRSTVLVLVIGQALLSYCPLTLGLKVWAALFGLVIPLAFLWMWSKRSRTQTPSSFLEARIFPPLPAWSLLLLFLSACAIRFYRLTTLSQWPLMDDGIFGYFAIRLSEKWDGSLVQGFTHLPTLFTWAHGALFRWLGPSLGTLWLFPALLSCMTILAAWWACRRFFPVSLSLIIAGFTAFGFWPLFLGRFVAQAVLMVLWEWLALGALGYYLKSPARKKTGPLLLLAAVTSAGFYTYLAWAPVAVMITLALWRFDPKTPGRSYRSALFCLTMATACAPLVWAYFHGNLDYVKHLWALGPGSSWRLHLELLFDYFMDLFWGGNPSTFHYGPLWGGFLNPVWGVFFALGTIVLLRAFRTHWAAILLGVFLLSFPALSTNNFEDMRMVQWIPFLAILSGFGIQSFLLGFRERQRILWLFLIFAIAVPLDLFHLLKVYPSHWERNRSYYGSFKSLEFFRAYSILRDANEKNGPGWILLNFHPDPYDQTLFAATYAFNAATNPQLRPGQARLGAIVANIHEEPFFKRMFPEASWTWLSQDLGQRDGGLILEMVPLRSNNLERLSRWKKADKALGDLTYAIMQKGVTEDQAPMLGILKDIYPLFEGDRLLESRYWRIVALHHLAEGRTEEAIQDEQKAVERGYPMAHLYDEMGCLLFKEKKVKEAKAAFEKAVTCRPNLTDAASNLRALSAQ